jgi:beta-galactosidase
MPALQPSIIAGLALLLWPAAPTAVAPVRRDATTTASAPRRVKAGPRQRTLFDFDWRFRAGEVASGQLNGLDDGAWERVDLPHDFMVLGKGDREVATAGHAPSGQHLPAAVEGPFDARSPGGSSHGYLNGGIGWYRKSFTLPPASDGRRVFLEFEGAYMNAEVWLNGQSLGVRPYGYSTFIYDATPYLRPAGSANVVAVRVQVKQPSSRWYSGAGIYRHVWLTITDPVHIDQWGTVVRTASASGERADLSVRLDVRNQSPVAVTGRAEVSVRDAAGRVIATADTPVAIGADGRARAEVALAVPQPRRWSVADPYLYEVEALVRVRGRVVDAERIPYGIRTIAFSPDSGFLLNGARLPLRGVCLHHDLGPLGAAAFDRGIERQLEIMKRMGVNAIRTSHNPPAPALLDLADRMGFVVMDEVFDEWKINKTRFGYGLYFDAWSERDARDMVRRDRNHPSVVMWSIGNEIPEQGDSLRAEAMATRLATFVREEDPTRFVTAGMDNPNGALRTGFAKPLDLFGINYHLNVYPTVRGMKAFSSESSSDYSSRDQYNLVLNLDTLQVVNRLNHHVTSYDFEGPSWGNNAEAQFKAMREYPWIAGEFVWTGIDYIGEPTPFEWPNRSSSFGIVDITGFPKDRFFLYQSQWRAEPMVHLLPHWNWPATYEGKPIPVWTYTNADSVELFLNGRSQGVRTWRGVTDFHLAWQVPYAPGALRAVAWRGGRVVAEDRVETTGAPAKLEMTVDRPIIRADGQDLAFVTVRVLDAQGRLVRAGGNNLVRFTLTGGGAIAALDNGDPTNHEPFVGATPAAAQHRAFNGLALVVLRAPRAGALLTLAATADGLAGTNAAVKAR